MPSKPLEALHMYTIGPFRRSLQGHRYIVVIVDAFIRILFLIPVKRKNQIASEVVALITRLQRRFEKTIRVIRSDNGSEFRNKTLLTYTKQQGITHEWTIPHQPSQNGLVEQHNRLLKRTMKALLLTANCSKRLWDVVAIYSAQIWKCLPRPKQRFSPFQKLTGKRLHFLLQPYSLAFQRREQVTWYICLVSNASK